jgi:hypothetical protein
MACVLFFVIDSRFPLGPKKYSVEYAKQLGSIVKGLGLNVAISIDDRRARHRCSSEQATGAVMRLRHA